MSEVLQIEDQTEKYLFPEISNPNKRAFLVAYSEIGQLMRAAVRAKVSYRNHYNWMREDEVYAACFDRAKTLAADRMEDEVYRRGHDGTDHPIIHKGVVTGTYKEYSDVLAMFYLKGARPERYRDNFEGLPNGGRIQINIVNYARNNAAPLVRSEVVSNPLPGGNGRGQASGGVSVATKTWKRHDNT